MRSVKPLPVTPDGLAGQAPKGPPQTDEARRATFLGSLPKRGKVKGIAAGIAVASSGATSLLPTTLRTFPETERKLDIPESWVKRYIVTPVEKMVRSIILDEPQSADRATEAAPYGPRKVITVSNDVLGAHMVVLTICLVCCPRRQNFSLRKST